MLRKLRVSHRRRHAAQQRQHFHNHRVASPCNRASSCVTREGEVRWGEVTRRLPPPPRILMRDATTRSRSAGHHAHATPVAASHRRGLPLQQAAPASVTSVPNAVVGGPIGGYVFISLVAIGVLLDSSTILFVVQTSQRKVFILQAL